MKYKEHLKRFKNKIALLVEENKKLKTQKDEEKDYSIFFTEAHWAVYHLTSALLDFIDIPEKYKHLNHRNIKRSLNSPEVFKILGDEAKEIIKIYNEVLIYYSKGEYSYSTSIKLEDFKNFKDKIKKLKEIIKKWLGNLNEKG